jgi:hypothetical protein
MPELRTGGWKLSWSGTAPSEDDPSTGGKEEPPKGTAPGGVDPAADAAALAKANASIRSLLQRTGTALGAAATVLLAGLGWTRLHDILPIPAGECWLWPLLAITGAVLGSAWLAAIFFYAQQRILIGTTEESRQGLRKRDRKIVDRVLSEHSRQELAPKLLDLELRALRLERLARAKERADEDQAKGLQAEAERLSALVRISLHRAASTVLEGRSRRAFVRWPTIAALLLGVSGIASTFAIADSYKGKRDALARSAKEAATDAKEAKAAHLAAAGRLSEGQRRLLIRARVCDRAATKVSRSARAEIIVMCLAQPQ